MITAAMLKMNKMMIAKMVSRIIEPRTFVSPALIPFPLEVD
jgi:hypothetical protein